jgi:hypothetical protein
MPRLGELLVAEGLVTADQVEQALRAQVMWGARLGTNLIELGCLDVDGLSRALGRQHQLPVALARHFERADPELGRRVPRELAERFSFLPLLALADGKIALVALGPLDDNALATIASVLDTAPEQLVVSVAAEMRIRYHLERVYGIARATRFLRTKGASITPFPKFDNVPVPIDADADIAAPVAIDERAHPTGRAEVASSDGVPARSRPASSVDELIALIDSAIDSVMTPAPPPEPSGRDRRSYVRTLGEDATQPVGVPRERALEDELTAPVSLRGAAPHPEPARSESQPLGRIAIRRVPIAPADEPALARSADSLGEALREIRRGPDRDRVAELVMTALDRFVPTCAAAMLLVIRGDIAISWKRFARSDQPPPELAVPLDQPGLVPAAIAHNATTRGTAAELAAIDRLLLDALGGTSHDLIVCPIAIADRVMCLIAAASSPDAGATALESIGAATAAAFARLIRDASR